MMANQFPLPLIPVLDLLAGEVVRGIAGLRQNYRPIVSRLTDSTAPGDVAAALANAFAPMAIYVADLDAIQHDRPQWEAYRAIAAAGVPIWLDAGTATSCAVQKLKQFLRQAKIAAELVVGLESLKVLSDLEAIITNWGTDFIFSLDMKRGKPLTEIEPWEAQSPFELATELYELGIRRMILLDLAAVGIGAGVPTLDLAARLRNAFPGLELIGGGGVRSRDDLNAMASAGFSAALVASALHDGSLSAS